MAVDDWAGVRDAFDPATRWCVRTAPAGRGSWDKLALGEWTAGDLLGHTSRALVTVESYLDKPASAPEVASPADYFRLVLASSGDLAAVAQRGRDAGTPWERIRPKR